MAARPVFIPTRDGPCLVREVQFEFKWHPGMAPSQKRKNVIALHQTAAARGFEPLLEISSKSERLAGQRLSAFNLSLVVDGSDCTVECAFQGSKVFENGGPFTDLYGLDSRRAKKDDRLRTSGRLLRFHFEGKDYPLSPPSAFYDWLYIRALYPHRDWSRKLDSCAGFTDIEFNPDRSLNCQARSLAVFMSLMKRDTLDEAVESFDVFRQQAALTRL